MLKVRRRQRQKASDVRLGRAGRSHLGVRHWIAPNMHVQTFAAAHDAASTLVSLHICTTVVAMLAATAASPLAREVAFLIVRCPCVRIIDLVVYIQK